MNFCYMLWQRKPRVCVSIDLRTNRVLGFLKSLKRETEPDRKEILPPPTRSEQLVPRRGSRKQKAPQTRLVVTMPDGKVIDHHSATQTWIETILGIGAGSGHTRRPRRTTYINCSEVPQTLPAWSVLHSERLRYSGKKTLA